MIIDEMGYLCKGFRDTNDKQLYEFKKYYYLYEYSDNIQLITDNPQYPSMLNYVKTGILTEEEMIQALLYKQVHYGKEAL